MAALPLQARQVKKAHRNIRNVVVMQQRGCDHDGLMPEKVRTVFGSIWKQSLSHALESLPGLARGDGIPHLTHAAQLTLMTAVQAPKKGRH